MDPLKMYFLLNMGIFHGYVSLPEGTASQIDALCSSSLRSTAKVLTFGEPTQTHNIFPPTKWPTILTTSPKNILSDTVDG